VTWIKKSLFLSLKMKIAQIFLLHWALLFRQIYFGSKTFGRMTLNRKIR
jgi:hypothetical protein